MLVIITVLLFTCWGQYQEGLKHKTDLENMNLNKKSVEKVYNSLLWPTPAIVMEALITGAPNPVDGLFADGAKGRVDPLGEFYNMDGFVEYFYGAIWTGISRVSKVVFQKLLAEKNLVAIRVRVSFDNYNQDQSQILYSYNLTQTSIFTLNDKHQVLSLESIIHNLGWESDPVTPKTPETIQGVCYTILNVAHCNSTYDPIGYYTDMADCINHLTNVYDWGSWDVMRSNSSRCRIYHSLLAIGRPQVHCVHTGKNGGDKCIYHAYADYYNLAF